MSEETVEVPSGTTFVDILEKRMTMTMAEEENALLQADATHNGGQPIMDKVRNRFTVEFAVDKTECTCRHYHAFSNHTKNNVSKTYGGHIYVNNICALYYHVNKNDN